MKQLTRHKKSKLTQFIKDLQKHNSNLFEKSAMWVGNMALFFMIPFAINNFIQQRWLVAVVGLFIVIISLLNTLSVVFKKRYFANWALYYLAPGVLLFLVFSIHYQGIIGILWSYPALVSFFFTLPERQAWRVNIMGLTICLIMSWVQFDPSLAIRITATLILCNLFSAVSIRLINKQQAMLHKLAVTDSLTGLFNRNALNQIISFILTSKPKNQRTYYLMIIDVDHFKHINDQWGHDTGDYVLKSIADLLTTTCQNDAASFRFGGEEFMVVTDQISNNFAHDLAERLRLNIYQAKLLKDHPVSVSIGISEYKPEITKSEWFKLSDQRMYQAKELGRNRTVFTG